MANPVHLTLNGQLQGLISAGCSSQDSIGNKAQIAHTDQIMVLALTGAERQPPGAEYYQPPGQIHAAFK